MGGGGGERGRNNQLIKLLLKNRWIDRGETDEQEREKQPDRERGRET